MFHKFIFNVILKMSCACLLLFYVDNSYAQGKSKNTSVEINTYEVSFYLGSSPQNIIYSVLVKNDSIKAENYSPTRRKGKPSFSGKLSGGQMAKLYSLYKRIDTVPITKHNPYLQVIDEGWGALLLINKVITYDDTDFSMESTRPDIKKLMKYLIKLGHMEIEFR